MSLNENLHIIFIFDDFLIFNFFLFFRFVFCFKFLISIDKKKRDNLIFKLIFFSFFTEILRRAEVQAFKIRPFLFSI